MKPAEEEIFNKRVEMIGNRFIKECGAPCIERVIGLELIEITPYDVGCFMAEYMHRTYSAISIEIQSDLQQWIERESENDERDDVSVDDPANYLKREL